LATNNLRFTYLASTTAFWDLENPVLLSGEIGIELDTNRIKVGDSLRSWSNLPYLRIGPAGTSEVPEGTDNTKLYLTAAERLLIEDLQKNAFWELITSDIPGGYLGYQNLQRWKIKKKTGVSPTITRTYADIESNPDYYSFNYAWANRDKLIYV